MITEDIDHGEQKYFLAYVEEQHKGDLTFRSYFRIAIGRLLDIEVVLDALARHWYKAGDPADDGYYHSDDGSVFVKAGLAKEVQKDTYTYLADLFDERHAVDGC